MKLGEKDEGQRKFIAAKRVQGYSAPPLASAGFLFPQPPLTAEVRPSWVLSKKRQSSQISRKNIDYSRPRQGLLDHFLKILAQQHPCPHPQHPSSQERNIWGFINMKGKSFSLDFCSLISRACPKPAASRSGCIVSWAESYFLALCSLQQPPPPRPHSVPLGKNIAPLSFSLHIIQKISLHSLDFIIESSFLIS